MSAKDIPLRPISRKWPLTMRQHEAVKARCEGMNQTESADYLGIQFQSLEKLVQRALATLKVGTMNEACYRMGRHEAEQAAKQTIANYKRYAKAAKDELEKAQIASAREGETGRRNTVGTERQLQSRETPISFS